MAYEFYQNTLTVPAALLYEDGEILTKPNYDKLCRVGKIRRAREGKGLGNYALVEFATIPERFRVKIIAKLGYPPKKQVQHQILKYRTTDYEAVDFFATYMVDENRTLSPEHQEQYVADAEMLQALDAYIKEMKMFRKSRGGSITKVWADAAKALAEVKEQTGHKLPGTDRRLRDKLEAFQKDGYKSLISEKFLGKNAKKVKDPQQEALLRSLLRDHRNLDNERIAALYEHTAQVMGWKSLTASGIANYRKLWKLYTYGGNHGEKSFDNQVGMQVKRTAPSSPLLYWTLDGWDVELYYQKSDNGQTYSNRLTVVVVLDPSLKYPIGYAIGEVETADLIKGALRNAILHTEELFGAKHKVLQLQSDNYARKKMLPIYQFTADHYTPAKVGNAKSKVIEPWFKYLNKKYCQLMPNWSGHGVKSKHQANHEYQEKIKKNFPDQFGCIAQITAFIEREREELRDQYLQAYAEMPEDAKKFVTEKEFLLHFGQETGFLNSRSHSGIAPKIEGNRYYYDSFDSNFRRYDHLSWKIKYNPDDLTQVLAYNEENQLSFLLQQKHEQPMALYDRQEGDGEQLQLVRNFNKEIKNEILEIQADDARTVSEFFTDYKELDGSLVKTLLTDSRGQHKDRKNAKRLQPAQKMIERHETREAKAAEQDWSQSQEQYLKQKVNLNKYLENND